MLPLFVAMLAYSLQIGSPEKRHTALVLLTLSWTLSAGLYVALYLLTDPPINILQSYVLFGSLILLLLLLRASATSPNPSDALARA
jgi:uncharacterized MAPEG superfamily protein